MATTFKKTPSGTVEVFKDGLRTSTVSLQEAQRQGFQDTTTPERTLTPIGTDKTLTPSAPKTLEQESNPLIDFSDALSKVTDLARKKRNRMTLELLDRTFDTSAEPASGFAGILADVNRAGQEFTEGKIAGLEDKGELTSETVGGFEVLRNKRTGDIVSTRSTSDKKADKKAEEVSDREHAGNILDANLDALDSELKESLLSETDLSVTDINSIIANRVSNRDLNFEAEELTADFFEEVTKGFAGTFTGRETEIKSAKEKAIADVREGGVIEIDGKEIRLTPEIQEKIIAIINDITVDIIEEIIKIRKEK